MRNRSLQRVTYKGRSYLILWFATGPRVSVEYLNEHGHWVSRSLKAGPTRDAVLAAASPA